MATAIATVVARKLRDAFAGGWDREHLDQYAAMMADDFEVRDSSFPLKGKEAIRTQNEAFLAMFPDMSVEVLSEATGDDLVAAEVTIRFTFDKPVVLPQLTIPPTGRHIEITYAAFYRFNSQGQLTSVTNYGSNFLEALGVKR